MKNYTIIRGENKYSAFSGTQLIAQMFKNLNLEEKISSVFKSPYSFAEKGMLFQNMRKNICPTEPINR